MLFVRGGLGWAYCCVSNQLPGGSAGTVRSPRLVGSWVAWGWSQPQGASSRNMVLNLNWPWRSPAFLEHPGRAL